MWGCFKARLAELEARGRQLEAEKVEAEKALCKEKRGKDSDICRTESFSHFLSLTCLFFRAGGLHQGRRGAALSPGGGQSS